MKYRIFFSTVCMVLIFSGACNISTPAESESLLTITSPSSDATYREGQLIAFSVDKKNISENLTWNSSLQGELSHSNRFFLSLLPGIHEISVLQEGEIQDNLSLYIEEISCQEGEELCYSISGLSTSCLLPTGRYSPVLYNMGASSSSLKITGLSRGDLLSENKEAKEDRDFLKMKTGFRNFSFPISGVISPGRASVYYSPGDQKVFHIADTTGNESSGFNVTSELLFQSEKLNLWLDLSSQKDAQILSDLWIELNNRAAGRVMNLWPGWKDLNGNSRVDILISPTINAGGVAIGFFNQADFFPCNNDISSEAYNPVSNEMDIVYLADPCENPDIFAYSKDSLVATFCHEFCHLVNYSHKSSLGISEELFLDEGLAHLTESLCGYGETGGNLAFLAKYLSQTALYSLNGEDADGAADSVGKRGAVSAFLSWIFWEKADGFTWNPDNTFSDAGGVAFLHRLLRTDQQGWDNISQAAGESADQLFRLWVSFMGARTDDSSVLITDSWTGQALNMEPFFGDLIINGTTYSLHGPVRYSEDNFHTLIPYGAMWLEPIQLEFKQNIIIEAVEQPSGISSGFLKL